MIARLYSQSEALELLKQNGVEITSRTLQNYINDGIMPMPFRKNLGRAGGVVTSYTLECIAQAYASWRLMNGDAKVTASKVREIREIAVHILENHILEKGYASRKELLSDDYLKAKLDKRPLEVFLIIEWLKSRAKLFYRDPDLVLRERFEAWESKNKCESQGNTELAQSYSEQFNELSKEINEIKFFTEKDSTSYHISGLYGFVVKFSWGNDIKEVD